MTKAYTRQSKNLNPRYTPQSAPIPGTTQVKNAAGGYVFSVSKWDALRRFLILGSEGGTYYVGEQKFTKDNASNVLACIKEDGRRVVDAVVDVSVRGLAPKRDSALFVLALTVGFGDESIRKYALDKLQRVARTGTDLFHFADYVNNFRGWGPGLRKAISRWYTSRSTESLAFQLVKYQSRDGWSNRDLFRLSHTKTDDETKNLAIRWSVRGVEDNLDSYNISPLGTIYGYEMVKRTTDEAEIISLINRYQLPLEMVPTEKRTPKVWSAVLPNLGVTALIRNLGNLSKVGVLTAISDETKLAAKILTDPEILSKGRVHPFSILNALNTFKSGRGFRGSGQWNVITRIVDALDEAFYLSFKTIRPTNKRILFGLDVSSSMRGNMIVKSNIDARVGSAAMAMATARVEYDYEFIGFTADNSTWKSPNNSKRDRSSWGWVDRLGVMPLDISPRRRLDDVVRYIDGVPFGATDCALPMLYAMDTNKKFDAFVIYTDNESWAGDIHASQALKMYRERTGIPAKLVVVAMAATEYSIADPNDSGMMDVVGFDASAPNIISDFIRGDSDSFTE